MKKITICIILFISIYFFAENLSDPVIPEDDIVDLSFSAVGDNLIHASIYLRNKQPDGSYYLNNIYKNTNRYTQNVDISYINSETICAGKELTLSNYPLFNGPAEVMDAIVSAGFNWTSAASNHSFDRGEEGILKQLDYVHKNFPQLTMTGIHNSKEDADQCQVINIKGVNIGLLSYTYGLNSHILPTHKTYLVDLIDKEKMQSDMDKLKKVSDIQIVSMHWGDEYQFTPNANQYELAQYLSDLGVDVIIGTHPHVIQPMDYLTGKDGNQTLVMYSLGNFLSAQDVNSRMLGGMVKWHIKYNKTNKDFSFENVQFYPTITQIGPHFSSYETYALKDWNDELGKKHHLYQQGQKMSREYFIELIHKVMNDKFEIIY